MRSHRPKRVAYPAGNLYAAADYLRTLPFVDRERIGAVGWSHGGWAVLWADYYADAYPRPLAAIVAFYPGCGDVPSLHRQRTPILCSSPAGTTWTPAWHCQTLAQSATEAGRPDVSAVVYPEALHCFDCSHLPWRVFVAAARGGRGATVGYDSRVDADSDKRVVEFLGRYLRRRVVPVSGR